MCSGFGLTNFSRFALEERYQINLDNYSDEQLFQFRFHPKDFIPTVSHNSPNKLVMRYWSLVPPWISDLKDLYFSTFNARSETVAEKPAFRTAWQKNRRCLIPASHFFEWQKTYQDKEIIKRTPYTIRSNDHSLFSIGGIYQPWEDFETCTILTTTPNSQMESIHNRMPVIIAKEDEADWLDDRTDNEVLQKMMQPLADGKLAINQGLK